MYYILIKNILENIDPNSQQTGVIEEILQNNIRHDSKYDLNCFSSKNCNFFNSDLNVIGIRSACKVGINWPSKWRARSIRTLFSKRIFVQWFVLFFYIPRSIFIRIIALNNLIKTLKVDVLSGLIKNTVVIGKANG